MNGSEKPKSPRRPWIAAGLTFITPGLGHVYVGRPYRGFVALAGLSLASIVWVATTMWISSPTYRLVTFAVLLILFFAVIADAIRLARRSPPGYTLRPYNRAWIYIAVFLAMSLVIQPILSGWISDIIGRAYVTPGNSMSPALVRGDHVMVAPYSGSDVSRGDIVAWQNETGTFMQRVVGMPGDTLEMRGKNLYLGGIAFDEPYVSHLDFEEDPADPIMGWQRAHLVTPADDYEPSRDNWGPIVVPDGYFFLLGDNRDQSLDGRYLGFVPRSAITGRPVWIYFSRDPQSGIRFYRMGRDVV